MSSSTTDRCKAPAIFSIDEHAYSEIIPGIESRDNWMLLAKNEYTRGSLVLFAMALGWHNGLKVPIKRNHGGGFARRESLLPKVTTLIDALHFAELGYSNVDDLRYRADAYSIAAQYANGGFHLIEGELQGSTKTIDFALGLIADMDAMYEGICKNAEEI